MNKTELLEDLFFEQADLELTIREEGSQEVNNRLKSTVARLETAIKRNYGEMPPKVKNYYYLKFLYRQLKHAEQELETIRQFIAEIEQNKPYLPPCMPGSA